VTQPDLLLAAAEGGSMLERRDDFFQNPTCTTIFRRIEMDLFYSYNCMGCE